MKYNKPIIFFTNVLICTDRISRQSNAHMQNSNDEMSTSRIKGKYVFVQKRDKMTYVSYTELRVNEAKLWAVLHI